MFREDALRPAGFCWKCCSRKEAEKSRITSAGGEPFELELGHGILIAMNRRDHLVGIRFPLAVIAGVYYR